MVILEEHGEALYTYLKKKIQILEENGFAANDAERALLEVFSDTEKTWTT
ncbi:MAG: hypothetical protein O2794_03955 [bacterium]|nr:hypothetical protein [bacterium]